MAVGAVPGEDRLELFLDAAQDFVTEDGVEILALAGAVLSGLEMELGDHRAVPVIDPVKCAVAQAQGRVLLGLNAIRKGCFAHLQHKACLNCPPQIEAIMYDTREKHFPH